MTRSPDELIAAMASTARLTPFDDTSTWHDALFEPALPAALSLPEEPDRALLTALAHEYATADEHAASISKRLRGAWLRDILGIPRLPAVPDRVIAHADVDPKLAPAVLPISTRLRGGKDAVGGERRYRTLDALTAHGSVVEGVRVSVPPSQYAGRAGLVLEAPDYPLELPVLAEPLPVGTFAPPNEHSAPHVLRISSPALGFVGERMTVKIGLSGVGGNATLFGDSARWRWPLPDGTLHAGVGSTPGGGGYRVTMFDGCVDPAGGDPWIEAVIPADSAVPANFQFSAITVSVVERSAIVPEAAFYNEGSVDITKEFQPFGSVAKRGDAFYLRCDEALSKSLNTITVNVSLLSDDGALLFASNLGSGMSSYYRTQIISLYYAALEAAGGDTTGSEEALNELWSVGGEPGVEWQRLSDGEWELVGTSLNSFATLTDAAMLGKGSELTEVSGQPGRYLRAFLRRGDFGWEQYQADLANFATQALRGNKPVMPPMPAPPIAQSVTVTYTTNPVPASRVEATSGWAHRVMTPGSSFSPFAAGLDSGGTPAAVAIGLTIPETAFGSTVSLYIDLESASPCGANAEPVAKWEWWDGHAWKPLPVADGTSVMRESGLVRFVAPFGWAEGCDDVSAASGRWIRMVTDSAQRIGAIRNVIPDAVVAEFVSSASQPELDISAATALPAGTIKGTVTPIPGVKKVTNLASVRGRGPETDEEYAARAAALVRHRGRAVSPWDYEQHVRLEFPEVAAVRCLPHTGSDGKRAPGQVGIVAIPDAPGELQPRPSVGLSGRVADMLRPLMPAGAKLTVQCPKYVPVTVSASLKLLPGVSALSGRAAVTDALETLLHPTAAVPTRWGRGLHKSTLIASLERIPEVDVVVSCTMDGPGHTNVELIDVDACVGLYCSSGEHQLTCVEQL